MSTLVNGCFNKSISGSGYLSNDLWRNLYSFKLKVNIPINKVMLNVPTLWRNLRSLFFGLVISRRINLPPGRKTL